MKNSELKVIAVILAMTLVFTFLATNAVSVASIILLAKNDMAAVSSEETQAGDNTATQSGVSSTLSGSTSSTPSGSTSSTPGTGSSSSSSSSTATTAPSSGSSSTATTAPSANNTATTKPADDANKPADDANKPADDANKPADDANKPADDANKPADDANKPADDTNKPADDAAQNPAAPEENAGGDSANAEVWSTEKAFNFYKTAAHDIATKGTAGYNKIEWQVLENLQVGSIGSVVQPFIDNFMTTKEEASVQVSEKGSDDAKNRFPDCTLTDLSKVVSAEKKDLDNGNYEITIIMQDEDTPMNKETSFLAQVTSSVLFWEDIERTIQEDVPVVSAINSRSVNYKGYKITAEMTKDGQFVFLGHYATVEINANAKIVVTLDVGGTLYNNCEYSEFKY